ncbi:MAG: nascent polypeptide-associated complex protein [Promethearchaeota archaeon]
MAKIPKGLRKNLQSGRGPRTTRRAQQGARGGGMGSRNMRRAMQQMGIDMEEIDASEVIIKCPDRVLRIPNPQVSLINQQGQEIYQVIGASEELPVDGASGPVIPGEDLGGSWEAEDGGVAEEPLKVEITPQDVQLVMSQTNCTPEQAESALAASGGDLARAIMDLKARNA